MVNGMPNTGSGLAGSEGSMTLPLSKYYNPEQDLPELVEELVYVNAHFTKDAPQSEHRRWEYAMALRALYVWEQEGHRVSRVVDVGGAGSPFWRMVSTSNVSVVDPHENSTLEGWLAGQPRLSPVVTCLSVLEHVEDLDQFLYHLSCLVAPGGLLFLTLDCCGCGAMDKTDYPYPANRYHAPTADPHHFNGMRKRIFTPDALRDLCTSDELVAFSYLGDEAYVNYTPRLYGGATDPGYSFASLALVKRA